ncbi:hypothetical protein Q8A73_022529 [Channa argus]|nr:hypothetical protein Q8A73_022529 [Channa argus]
MAIIYLDHNLRTPKYVAVFNLAFVDLFGSSALVPKVIDIFLVNHPNIPYSDCLTFLFFCYTCLCMQSFNLVALSYDRLVAIIFPLHYQVKVTHSSALVPKVIDIFLLNQPNIPYSDCLTFLFFCYTCLCMQSFNLVALSYDRLVAIIFPLHYQVKVTHSSALVPKVIDIFLLNHPNIPYSDCLTFLFFCYTCLCMQSFNLVALSYDRLVAIIFPLHYQH